MRPHHAIAIGSFGWITGILLAPLVQLELWAAATGLGLLFILLFRSLSPLARMAVIFSVGLLLGWWRHELHLDSFPLPPANLPAAAVSVEGVIVSDPEVIDNRQRARLDIHKLDGLPVNFRALAYSWHLPKLSYGTEIVGDFQLKLPENTDDFDYVGFLAKDQVSVIAYAEGDVGVVGSRESLTKNLYELRHNLQAKISKLLPGTPGSLLSGLLLGTRASLPDDFRDNLQRSGTSHIVALSGFNLTVIIGLIVTLLRVLPYRPRLIVSGAIIVLFVIMSGATSSVVRAAIMGCLLLLSGILGRRQYLLNAVLLAVVVMTATNPAILQHDIGFQLSLSATVGMVWLMPLILGKLKRLPHLVAETFATTVAASVFALPILLYHFASFSIVGLVANLLVVPVVPIAMGVGFAAVVASLLSPVLNFISFLAWLPLRWIEWVVTVLGSWSLALVELPKIPPGLVVGYYLLMFGLIYYWGNAVSSSKSTLANGRSRPATR